jgi:hypothetical protein
MVEKIPEAQAHQIEHFSVLFHRAFVSSEPAESRWHIRIPGRPIKIVHLGF